MKDSNKLEILCQSVGLQYMVKHYQDVFLEFGDAEAYALAVQFNEAETKLVEYLKSNGVNLDEDTDGH